MQMCPSGKWPISWFHFHNQQSSNFIIIICLLKFLAESEQQLAEIWLLLIWLKKVKQLISCQPLSMQGTPAEFDHDQLGICFPCPGTTDLPLAGHGWSLLCVIYMMVPKPTYARCLCSRMSGGGKSRSESILTQCGTAAYKESVFWDLSVPFASLILLSPSCSDLSCLVTCLSPSSIFVLCLPSLLTFCFTLPHSHPVKWYCIPS